MKLKNRNPRDFIGRIIIFRHIAWRIDGVTDEHVKLSRPALGRTGSLRRHLFERCTLHPLPAEIRARFPMLLRALQTTCLLSELEAVNAMFCMITYGRQFLGSEAIALLGGPEQAIRHCWRERSRVRELFAREHQAA
jgi:hypothetical protein